MIRSKLVSTLSIWGGMAISGLVIPGQVIAILILGFLVGFLTLHASIRVAKVTPAPASRSAHIHDPMGGPRFFYGLIASLLGGAAYMFWLLWRDWASLEGHIVLASTALYLPAVLTGFAIAMASRGPKMFAA